MVAGYHLIWTAYGWWLPNDPRGSSSHEIRVERIADLGDLHFGRKEVQPKSEELRCFFENARARSNTICSRSATTTSTFSAARSPK